MKMKYFAIALTLIGLTQLYQNCAPIPQFETLDQASLSPASVLPVTHPPDTTKLTSPQKNPGASREYISQILTDIFTSTSTPVPNLGGILHTWIQTRPNSFGGKCSLYDSNTLTDCSNDSANTMLSSKVETTSVRQTLKIQVCEQILSNDQAITAALEKIQSTSATPNASSIGQLYSLFRRGWDPDPAFVATLVDMDKSLANKKIVPLERWRAVLLVICEDPFWEYP